MLLLRLLEEHGLLHFEEGATLVKAVNVLMLKILECRCVLTWRRVLMLLQGTACVPSLGRAYLVLACNCPEALLQCIKPGRIVLDSLPLCSLPLQQPHVRICGAAAAAARPAARGSPVGECQFGVGRGVAGS